MEDLPVLQGGGGGGGVGDHSIPIDTRDTVGTDMV